MIDCFRGVNYVKNSKGRRISEHDVTSIYQYNDSGIRTQKIVGGVTTNYYLDGDKVVYETNGTDTIYYTYDENGDLIGFQLNNTDYYYVRNGQNDIIGILDSNGDQVVSYLYDSWGKLISTTGSAASTVGVANPYRYRGYRYDAESGLYYLQSRYYDANTGRFINADDIDSTIDNNDDLLSGNLFAYCTNDPVNHSDEYGNWKLSNWQKIAIGVAIIATLAIVTIATAGTGTALACVAVGALKGAAVGAAIGAASGAAMGAGAHRLTTGSWKGAGKAAWNGAADGFMTGAITGAVAGGVTSKACFVAGTTVLASTGLVAIETIKAGDLVWSENPETGEKALKRVEETYVRQTNQFVHIKVDGQNITTTPEHPFWVSQKGWTNAIKLRAGDILVLQNGKYVIVEQVQHEILERPATVYNFRVADFHTYYVTNSSILVHNANYGMPKPSSAKLLSDSFLKRNGIKDIHAFKADFVKDISKYDVIRDTKTGYLWLRDKAGKVFINTFEKLK